jgi:NAD(P)H-dependent FMN reductase
MGAQTRNFATYGGVAGARGIEQLRLVLIELRMVPLRDALHISNVGSKFENNHFAGDRNDLQQLNTVLEELRWWANVLFQGSTKAA